ncbi:MAG TPA: hypothetical protein VK934_10740 [Fimbriimonas sp.]|nr:hypothetical protein [Fimbriimonas sp.]
MKDSPKLSPGARRRLLVVLVLTMLAVAALAVGIPSVLTGPVGGSLAGY